MRPNHPPPNSRTLRRLNYRISVHMQLPRPPTRAACHLNGGHMRAHADPQLPHPGHNLDPFLARRTRAQRSSMEYQNRGGILQDQHRRSTRRVIPHYRSDMDSKGLHEGTPSAKSSDSTGFHQPSCRTENLDSSLTCDDLMVISVDHSLLCNRRHD